ILNHLFDPQYNESSNEGENEYMTSLNEKSVEETKYPQLGLEILTQANEMQDRCEASCAPMFDDVTEKTDECDVFLNVMVDEIECE
ncbi:hypothetical protein KI387_027020, partial [Taxus chinensis]